MSGIGHFVFHESLLIIKANLSNFLVPLLFINCKQDSNHPGCSERSKLVTELRALPLNLSGYVSMTIQPFVNTIDSGRKVGETKAQKNQL